MSNETLNQMVDSQKELLQNDLQCILDGVDIDIMDNVCQAVVDRMNLLKKTINSQDSTQKI